MQLPQSLLQSLQNVKGFVEKDFIAAHQNNEPVTSIRLNPSKINTITFNNVTTSSIPWSNHGHYLSSRPSFIQDPLWHAGAYYVQEASSMFLEQALKQTVDLSIPIKILDLCAAPGGKSTLIQSLINDESFLVSNEVIKTRVNILQENIARWGASNVIVTNSDPKDFKKLPNYFDVIIIDAPCSGSGLFKKDENAIKEWSENNVELCSQRQQRILADAFVALKAGGILIYSTCSYSKKENEDILDWVSHKFDVSSLPLKIEEGWGIVETQSDNQKNYGYRFYPNKIKGEGFFLAAFKKQNKSEGFIGLSKSKQLSLTAKEVEAVEKYVTSSKLSFMKIGEDIIAMPLCVYDELSAIQNLYIKKAGVKVGSIVKNGLLPDHELALSTIINNEVNFVEVNLENALQYLRKQEMQLQNLHTGWCLIKFNKLSLGWVKILPNRVNNYYPATWRILNK